MFYWHNREGHPYRDEKVPFDDLMDYALARARGDFINIASGRQKVNNGFLWVLNFNFERAFMLENTSDDLLYEELKTHLLGLKWCCEEDVNDEEDIDFEDDGEEDDGKDKIANLYSDSCFAVVIERFRKINGKLHLIVTAIHRKYRQAIVITKSLVDKKPFRIEEVDYDKVKQPFLPILRAFGIMY